MPWHRLATAGLRSPTQVRILGLVGHADDEVMALALADERILVTTDTDVGTIRALPGAAGPSVLLLRGIGDAVEEPVDALLEVLPRIERVLSEGAVLVIEPARYRIRYLPIDDAQRGTGRRSAPSTGVAARLRVEDMTPIVTAMVSSARKCLRQLRQRQGLAGH